MMNESWLEEQLWFMEAHVADDTSRLLLSADRYPGVDMPFIVDQIESRRRTKEKLPTWYANPRLLFPSKLSAEQCSSEITVAYKQRLIDTNASFVISPEAWE